MSRLVPVLSPIHQRTMQPPNPNNGACLFVFWSHYPLTEAEDLLTIILLSTLVHKEVQRNA